MVRGGDHPAKAEAAASGAEVEQTSPLAGRFTARRRPWTENAPQLGRRLRPKKTRRFKEEDQFASGCLYWRKDIQRMYRSSCRAKI